ncbi:MAG: hypothetical protein PHC57_06135, partial [Candidatus Cloacimonetes bacterium]|nr:hypothetical protein [Candidatus Cloacimonadota bacterium]
FLSTPITALFSSYSHQCELGVKKFIPEWDTAIGLPDGSCSSSFHPASRGRTPRFSPDRLACFYVVIYQHVDEFSPTINFP